jgi:nucleoside-diphosphate-sugar epimerase
VVEAGGQEGALEAVNGKVDPAGFYGKRALVTGGLGFIGSNLARRLDGLGAQVTIVDPLAALPAPGAETLPDLPAGVRLLPEAGDWQPLLAGQDLLFDLAGRVSHLDGMADPLSDLEANALAPLRMLEACRQANPGLRIVHAGTRQIYGRPQRLPVDEDHPLEPADYNGVSKLAGEWYHRLSHRIYGLQTTVLRMTNVYGPGMRIRDARKTFVGLWVRQLLEGGEITVYGDGRQLRDLNYVEDVVDALLLAVSSPQAGGQVYNLGANPVRLIDLAQTMIAVNGGGSYRLVPFPQERKRIDIGDYDGDFTRIRSELGWLPATSLRDGIAATLAYYRVHAGRYLA